MQFQGMIAEYERAQILERSRRGKRHRARQGEVSVLSGAPFGYHFIRKTDHSAAYYEIDEEQTRVVRRVFELYGVGWSQHWRHRPPVERTIPASDVAAGSARQCGACCAIRRTKARPRQDDDCAAPADHAADTVTRRRGHSQQCQPRAAARRLDHDSRSADRQRRDLRARARTARGQQGSRATADCHAQRRTRAREFGYALYRTSTRSSARAIHYYRCLGSLSMSRFRRLAAAFPAPFATTARCVRIFWTRSCGRKLCACSKILS